jgi:hypothetical protein
VAGLHEHARQLARLVRRDPTGYAEDYSGHVNIVPVRSNKAMAIPSWSYMSTRARVVTVFAACLVIIWLMALVVHGPATHTHAHSAAPAATSR